MTGREIEIIMNREISHYRQEARRCRDRMDTAGMQYFTNVGDALDDMRELLTSRRDSMVSKRKRIVRDYDQRAAELMAERNATGRTL